MAKVDNKILKVDKLSDLKIKAEEASKHWKLIPGNSYMAQSLIETKPGNKDCDEDIIFPEPEDAEFVAAASPDVVLKLIALIELYEEKLGHICEFFNDNNFKSTEEAVIATQALIQGKKIWK